MRQEQNYSSGSSYISKLGRKKLLESTAAKEEIGQKGSTEEKLDILKVFLFPFKAKTNPRGVLKRSGKLGCLKSENVRTGLCDVLLLQTCNRHVLFLTYHVLSLSSYLGYTQLLPASSISFY